MIGQNFGEHFTPSGILDDTKKETNNPEEFSNNLVEKVQEPGVINQETPEGSGIVHVVAPLNEMTIQPVSEAHPYTAPMVTPVVLPVYDTISESAPASVTNTAFPAPLLDPGESELLRKRWSEIQGKFVDEPRSAVQQADKLVSEVVEKITKMFANEHSTLESQWKQGNDVSTEELRKALQHYRSFFNRLVV